MCHPDPYQWPKEAFEVFEVWSSQPTSTRVDFRKKGQNLQNKNVPFLWFHWLHLDLFDSQNPFNKKPPGSKKKDIRRIL